MSNIYKLLSVIEQASKLHNLSQPIVCGGIPRDHVRQQLDIINDIDITTTGGDSLELAIVCRDMLKIKDMIIYDDSHSSFIINGIKVDFSSNFITKGIDEILLKRGISNPSLIFKEVYSRDFTINALLEDMKLNKIYDITKNGISDIKNKIIRCPLSPEITIASDPRRIIRALRFSLQFGYTIEDKLSQYIINNGHILTTINEMYVKKKINELVLLNPTKSIELLIQFDLLNKIPMTKLLSDKLIETKQLLKLRNA